MSGANYAPQISGGLYETNGPGTYKSIATWNELCDLKFDAGAIQRAKWVAACVQEAAADQESCVESVVVDPQSCVESEVADQEPRVQPLQSSLSEV